MPTLRGPDNSVRVAVSGTINGLAWAQVFHAQLTITGTVTQANLDAWTTAFAAAWTARLGSLIPIGTAQTLCKTTLYLPGGLAMLSSAPMTGTGSGAALNDNSAAPVISWTSLAYWRGGKPRTYQPGIAASNMNSDGHTVTSGYKTALTTAATSFRTDVNALTAGAITGTVFGFVSFYTGGVLRTPAVFFPFTGASVHARLGSQRRRLGKWLA